MAIDPICGMKVNEKDGLSVIHDGQSVFFCSAHCRERFIKEQGISTPAEIAACCHDQHAHGQAWYKNKVLMVIFVFIFLVGLSYFLPFLIPFRNKLFMYVRLVWWTILLGLLLGGVIERFVPREYISHLLARRKKRSILFAVLMGFLMSVCSHGILALSMQLYKKGASTAAVVAFLLASPWANFPLTLMLIGLFGVVKAVYLICVALVIAVVTGLIFQLLEKGNIIESNVRTSSLGENFSIVDDVKGRWQRYRFSAGRVRDDLKGIWGGVVSLSGMVLWWILVGMGLASLAGAYIPEHIFHQYMGPTVLGMMVTLALATVLEVCSEGTAPVAFEIYRQTGAFGNSLVFLMAGVATDYTEIGLLWSNIGPRTALWLPLVTVPQIIFWGWVGNLIF